jgi:rubrerythrin
MKELKGTKTEKNLMEAFAGESQARNKYTYFASAAKKEGYEQIAAFFLETAENEKEHAKIWLKKLNGIGNTIDNLNEAAHGENGEWSAMYPKMAAEAREEGFEDIAQLFEGVAKIESEHEERYKQLLQNIEQGTVFEKDGKLVGVITDYKTNRIYSPQRIVELIEVYEPQLQLYGMAVKELLYVNGIRVDDIVLQLYFIDAPKRVEVKYDESRAESQLNEMDMIFARNLSQCSPEDFPRKTGDGCISCQYRGACII